MVVIMLYVSHGGLIWHTALLLLLSRRSSCSVTNHLLLSRRSSCSVTNYGRWRWPVYWYLCLFWRFHLVILQLLVACCLLPLCHGVDWSWRKHCRLLFAVSD